METIPVKSLKNFINVLSKENDVRDLRFLGGDFQKNLMFRSNACKKTWVGTLSQFMSDGDLSVTGEICFSSNEEIKKLADHLSTGETSGLFF